ncbi:MAG: hypothetical protein EBQ71_20930 [Betaproteobacteria bacterium]|nr:hypothetical protein [Betaproteobacteria bacterium]
MKNSMLAKTLRRVLWGAVVFYFGTLASAQTFNEDTPVLAAPEAAAKVVGNARGSAAVKVVKRQGFWLEVEAGAVKGWVKISAVKLAAPIGPTAIDTGRLGSNNIVATSAARGLSAKDLLEGRSDEKAIERLNALRLEAQQIAQFAEEGGLGEVKLVMFLRVPAAAPPPAATRSDAAPAGGSADSGPRPRRPRKAGDDDM